MIELAWVRSNREVHEEAEVLFKEAARRAELALGADDPLARQGLRPKSEIRISKSRRKPEISNPKTRNHAACYRLPFSMACRYYGRGWLSIALAARLAALDRDAFGVELGERSIPRHTPANTRRRRSPGKSSVTRSLDVVRLTLQCGSNACIAVPMPLPRRVKSVATVEAPYCQLHGIGRGDLGTKADPMRPAAVRSTQTTGSLNGTGPGKFCRGPVSI
jgi:predicted HTH domain antitoxin